MAKWAEVITVRDAVNGALEAARAAKTIGKSLEAKVFLTVPAQDSFLADMDAEALADLFIVSQVELTVGEGLSVSVAPATGAKCARCWKFHDHVGEDGLCPRCHAVLNP